MVGLTQQQAAEVTLDTNVTVTDVDVVVGSSMGALIGALWTSGMDSYELEKVARELLTMMDSGKLGVQMFEQIIAMQKQAMPQIPAEFWNEN